MDVATSRPRSARFLQTETGSAAVLLAAAVAALVWANVDPASYERVWTTTLSITIGGAGISQSLRGWINTGLMAFFFFVIGLEARREFDLGELRDRRRVDAAGRRGARRDARAGRDLPRVQRGPRRRRTAGERRCRRTRRSRSACSRSSAPGSPTACAPTC